MERNTKIFAIYSSKDKDELFRLLRHLESFKTDYNVSVWQDDPVYPGQSWQPKDESRLGQADIFVLLLSDSFMHSNFIQQLEFKMVIDRYKAGEATVIPIILDECPWTTNFESEDYNFSFKELQVFPEGGRPITDLDSKEEEYKRIASHIRKLIPGAENTSDKASNEVQEKNSDSVQKENQIAIDFAEKEAEKKRLEEEAQAKERLKQEAQAKQRSEAEKRLKEEAEKRKVAEEKRLQQEAEIKRRNEEKKRLEQEAEAKRMAEEERIRQKAEHQRLIEEEQRHDRTEETAHTISEEDDDLEGKPVENQNSKRKIFLGLFIAASVIVAIILFTKSGSENEQESPRAVVSDTLTNQGPIVSDEPESEVPKNEETPTKLTIGDTFDGGIVFAIDISGKTGKIAHIDDAGPMPWQDAMIIHDQLGPGWRLPTLEELQIMYRNIGPGADNRGEFADGLYWSATDYDEYQARLLRFRDGNTSYHYNKEVESRRFLVRAVKDFGN